MSKTYTSPIIIVIAVAGLAAGCSNREVDAKSTPAGSSPKTAPEVSATRVEVAVLEGGSAAEQIVRPGEVQGAREAHLAAALGGYVEQVRVESGQQVEKGQVIARVDTSTHAADLKLVDVELADAKRELERLETLGKAVTSARVDAARTRVQRAEAQRRLAATRLARATIKAPFSGTLVDLDVEPGEVAAPGTPIGRLLVLDPIHVSVSVTDRDIGTLVEGAPALVTAAGAPQSVTGEIRRIEPAADPRTRTFLVEVEVPNPERKLLPGMIATVAFSRAGNGEALVIPQDLLVTRLKENGVFVIDADAVARWRALELGQVVGAQVEVRAGLQRGDRIVSVGHRGLADGDPVIVSRQGICCRDGRVVHPRTEIGSAP